MAKPGAPVDQLDPSWEFDPTTSTWCVRIGDMLVVQVGKNGKRLRGCEWLFRPFSAPSPASAENSDGH